MKPVVLVARGERRQHESVLTLSAKGEYRLQKELFKNAVVRNTTDDRRESRIIETGCAIRRDRSTFRRNRRLKKRFLCPAPQGETLVTKTEYYGWRAAEIYV